MQEEIINNESANKETEETRSKKSRNVFYILLSIVVIILMISLLVRPGVFTIQPIGVLPEGVTFIYHSRNHEMPFFSSPDGLCLQMDGKVSLLCRGIALSSSIDLIDRTIIKLPYIHWAYLRSTSGLEFDN